MSRLCEAPSCRCAGEPHWAVHAGHQHTVVGLLLFLLLFLSPMNLAEPTYPLPHQGLPREHVPAALQIPPGQAVPGGKAA